MDSILVVLNNGYFRKSFRDILKMYLPNLCIEEAADGKEALLRMESRLPAIIFTDITLPGKNGLQLTSEIKAAHPEITVVVLMGYDLPEYREKAYAHGADFLIPKDSLTGAQIARLIRSIQPSKAAGF